MANSVTIKRSSEVKEKFTACIFNADGQSVPGVWANFDVDGNQVWNPEASRNKDTTFYIAKGERDTKVNPSIAYAVKVDFNENTSDAVIAIGIGQVEEAEGSGCYYFEVNENESTGVKHEIIKDGVLINGTKLPSRCDKK